MTKTTEFLKDLQAGITKTEEHITNKKSNIENYKALLGKEETDLVALQNKVKELKETQDHFIEFSQWKENKEKEGSTFTGKINVDEETAKNSDSIGSDSMTIASEIVKSVKRAKTTE